MSPVFAPNCSPEAEEDEDVVALFSLVTTLVRGVVATGAAADDFLAAPAGSSPLNCRAVVMLLEVGVVGILVGVKALATGAA